MTEKNTRLRLLEKGLEMISKNGFNNTGIQEVLSSIGVPKGSFYHYFKSKQDFGLQILDLYASETRATIHAQLTRPDVAPLLRLRGLFEQNLDFCRENAFTGGCLIGNLSSEMGDVCPVFRQKLDDIWQECIHMVADCLREAQAEGSLDPAMDAQSMANFVFNAWHGAMVRMKVAAGEEPLRNFIEMVFDRILAAPVSSALAE